MDKTRLERLIELNLGIVEHTTDAETEKTVRDLVAHYSWEYKELTGHYYHRSLKR